VRPEPRTSRTQASHLHSAQTALDAGDPLRHVQLAARHLNPSTTTIYGRSSPQLGPPASSRCWWLAADDVSQTGGGSIRSIVRTRSIDRSKEATLPTPVLSAQATR
jgi:hypothetical protein